MESLTTENAMCTVLAYACGKSIAVTCHTQILVSLKYLLQLFDRSVSLKHIIGVHVTNFFPYQDLSTVLELYDQVLSTTNNRYRNNS